MYYTQDIQDLQTSTDTVKSTFDPNANQILNKTATEIIDKIKTQTEKKIVQLYKQRSKNLSQCMRIPTMWYVRPAKPQISLRICAV